VDSLLYQTLKNIEIILVDDGSSDNCPAMCDAYAEQDKRVKVLHQQNSGYGRTCNIGLDMARGEYLGIIESDDFVELTMFERLYSLAKSHELDIARCHFYFYSSRSNVQERVDFSYVPQNIIYSPMEKFTVFCQHPAIWANLYRASFIKENAVKFLETPGASFQDTSFAFKVYACANRFLLIEDTLVHYRIDNDNSSSNSKTKVYCVCDEFAEIERFAAENSAYDKLKFIIARLKYDSYIWNYKRLDKISGWRFMKIFSRDLRKYITRKTIRKALFSKKELLKLYVIAFFYPLYHIMWRLLRSK
jgi:glycosyltransferase involved in cell wall biosynthesis